MLPAASAVGPSVNAIVVATWTSETSWPMTAVNENNNNTLNANEVLTGFSFVYLRKPAKRGDSALDLGKYPLASIHLILRSSINTSAVARFARSSFCLRHPWGFASLHLRLYADTRFAGLDPIENQSNVRLYPFPAITFNRTTSSAAVPTRIFFSPPL